MPLPMAVDHYENFPVASWLCPPRLRPAVTAIYWFARTADDIADEGPATPDQRRAQLARYRVSLDDAVNGRRHQGDWPGVFGPLARAIAAHGLPPKWLHALLDAFMQDTSNPLYPHRDALLDYCGRSANPVGRLLLHLVDVNDARSLSQSDAICSALQLINFWQDLGRDLARGRCYLPAQDALACGLDLAAVRAGGPPGEAGRRLLRELVSWSQSMMIDGAPLALRIPGRFGWELRGVVQGGLRIVEKIERAGFNTWTHRPQLGLFDSLVIGWRVLRMSAQP